MIDADRRDMLRLAVGASLLPLLATQGLSAATPGTAEIHPPSGSMLCRRRLERGLPGGARLIVTREFRVRFEPVAAGFLLGGEQLSAHVEAPSNLGSLAALEERRVETGLFPLTLDPAGQIIDGSGVLSGTEVERAIQYVHERFPTKAGQERNEAVDFVEALHSTGTRLTAELPTDLFAPIEMARTESREIVLPWGDRGEVSTKFEAERDPQTQLMRYANREVMTRLGHDARHSFEGWELLPG